MSYALTRTCRLLRRRVHTLLGDAGLHRGQLFILHSLWEHEGYTQSELARRNRIRPATLTAMLQRMERDGLVERKPDPDDQRVSRVHLTEAGRRLRQVAEDSWIRIESEASAGFIPDELAQLRSLLQRVRENLTEAPEVEASA
jgi:DNA-binding MarR family transcriptional regulator